MNAQFAQQNQQLAVMNSNIVVGCNASLILGRIASANVRAFADRHGNGNGIIGLIRPVEIFQTAAWVDGALQPAGIIKTAPHLPVGGITLREFNALTDKQLHTILAHYAIPVPAGGRAARRTAVRQRLIGLLPHA